MDFSKFKRILIVRTDQIGDMVMTTPFLREMRKNAPFAKITLVVSPHAYNLVEICPYVNEVYSYNAAFCGIYQNRIPPVKAFFFAKKNFSNQAFDLAIVPRMEADIHHACHIAFYSRAKYRVAYNENSTIERIRLNKGYNHLLTHVVDASSSVHQVAQGLDILRKIGGKVEDESLELWATKHDEDFAESCIQSSAIENKAFAVLHFGAGEKKRQWLPKNYAILSNWLSNEMGLRILIIGGAKDKRAVSIFKSYYKNKVKNVIGRASLRQTYALLKKSALFIGSDSGPAHIAAAASIPMVVISCHPKTGSNLSVNSPCRIGAWTDKKVIVQPDKPLKGCDEECVARRAHCITAISPDTIKMAVQKTLSAY